MPYFPVPTLVLHKVFVLVCIVQHLLVELGHNLVICQCEKRQLVSYIDVVYDTPCFAGFKDSSIHVILSVKARNRASHFVGSI